MAEFSEAQVIGYKWRYTNERSDLSNKCREHGKQLAYSYSNERNELLSKSWQPELLLNNGENTTRLGLWNNHFDIKIGKRICMGFWSEKTWNRCPGKVEVAGQICNSCKSEDSYWLCKECTGSGCFNTKMRGKCETDSFIIYLASFGTLLKVGISRTSRFFERLIEQGADFGTKIAYCRDGLLVRQHEQTISKRLGITDFVQGKTKAAMLFENPNGSASTIFFALENIQVNDFMVHNKMPTDIINNSAANIDTNNFGFLTTPEIYDFREFYRLDKIIRQPKLLQIEQNVSLRGEVIAAKGPIIILRDRFHFFAVNAHQLLGREIKIAPNMMPESSCGAFS